VSLPDIVQRLRRLRCHDRDAQACIEDACAHIERLTAERDHARRLHCYAVAGTMQGRAAEDVAKSLGWDCFKEERCSTG
jgi:hypothetical protein